MSTTQEENAPQTDMDKLRATAESPLWDEEQCKLTYSYPVPSSEEVITKSALLAKDVPEDQRVKVGPFSTLPSPESHIGPARSAIDFAVEDGTPVLAAQTGKIVAIVESNERWGPTEEFEPYSNYVVLQHENGEFTQYVHLAKGSVTEQLRLQGLTVKDTIEVGVQIGVVGKNGMTTGDHLHLLVYRSDRGTEDMPNEYGFKSLVPKFK